MNANEILILNIKLDGIIAIINFKIDGRSCNATIELPKNYPKTQLKRVTENIIRNEILGNFERKHVLSFQSSKIEDAPRILYKEIAEILSEGQFVYRVYLKWGNTITQIMMTTPKLLKNHRDLHSKYIETFIPLSFNLCFGYNIEYDFKQNSENFDKIFEEHLQMVHGCSAPLKSVEKNFSVPYNINDYENLEDWEYCELKGIPLTADQEKQKIRNLNSKKCNDKTINI